MSEDASPESDLPAQPDAPAVVASAADPLLEPPPVLPSPEQTLQLYQAVIGTARQAYYLKRFFQFDAAGRPGPAWNWGAFASALNWSMFRGLWPWTFAYTGALILAALLVLGVGKLLLALPGVALLAALGVLLLAASVLPALFADAVYYRHSENRMNKALAVNGDVDAACEMLKAESDPKRWRVWQVLVNLVLAFGVAAVAATAWFFTHGDAAKVLEAATSSPAMAGVAKTGASGAAAAASAVAVQATASGLAGTATAASAQASGRIQFGATQGAVPAPPVTPVSAPGLAASASVLGASAAKTGASAATAAAPAPSPTPATVPPAVQPAAASALANSLAASAAIKTLQPAPARSTPPALAAAPAVVSPAAPAVVAALPAIASATKPVAAPVPVPLAVARPAAPATAPPAAPTKPAAVTKAAAAPVPAARPAPAAASGFYVQVGVFAKPANVKKIRTKLDGKGLAARYDELAVPAGVHTRVRVGPYATRDLADAAAERVQSLDLPGVVVKVP